MSDLYYTQEETVLDLPLKRQRELAALEKMTHEDWVESTKRDLQSAQEFITEIDTKESKLSPEGIKHMQAKMDSGNPR